MKNLLTIIKKELKRFFTDPRMLIGMFLPGILIFVLYTVMGDIMTEMSNPENEEYHVCVVNQPEEFESFLEVEGWTIISVDSESKTEEEILKGIKDQDIDLYIVYEEDFYSKMINYVPDLTSPSAAPSIEIYYNSANNTSYNLYVYYTSILDEVESQLTNKFDINPNVNVNYDVADSQDLTIHLMSMMLPFLLITFLFTGCMSVCSESIAGEKERGTIATLLITPVKRTHIVLGKVISLGITSLTSSIGSFIGLMLSLPSMMGGEFDISTYGIGTILLVLLLIFVTVLLFTTLLTIVSTFAKSVKEASSYSAPLMILVMLVGATNFMATSSATNPLLYIIPVYNVMQCFIGVFSLDVNIVNILICIASNACYIGLGIFALTRMFNNEKVIFN